MFSRIALILIVLFWVTMNVLLWRSEFGRQNTPGSTVPVAMVWQKILTAPDNSSLEIHHHGEKIGYCRWAAILGQSPASLRTNPPAEDSPEAMQTRFSDYRIDFEGNAVLGEMANRLRFDFSVRFSTNHVWQDFRLRLNLRPSAWDISSRASEAAIHVRSEDDDGKSERIIKFADLQNPEALAREIELPMLLPLSAFGWPRGEGASVPQSLGLKWEARNDWFTIGHTSVRAYRLQARLLDRYQVVVIVSTVGEILRVELPDELVFVNDKLTNL
ncbi:MAG: hypothetical protein JWR69_2898 [Pedosphaera sp.]|nr:hypothetical protein [Pedosphaera sp.]